MVVVTIMCWSNLVVMAVQGDLAALAVAMDGLRERWVVQNYLWTRGLNSFKIVSSFLMPE